MTEAYPKSGGLLLEKTEINRTGMTELPKRKRRKQGVTKTETSFVDDESFKENPSEYAIPAKKRGKRAKLSLSTRGKKRPATEITENESGKCERDRTGKKVKWDDNFKNENEFNFDIDSQKAKNAVEKIWALPDGTDYIAGKVHNVNIAYNYIRYWILVNG
ncbi:uncharacterized protein LOC127837246 [Dreissena polymorpha]|uniref:uncharacterized protein LOC127837246 n=1 Tax=Dreissena polymorpha TaxID=45954 RepID=UPI00226443E3|nr:uncharacterized protein LOC127837246 [Dreissena polymorpha]